VEHMERRTSYSLFSSKCEQCKEMRGSLKTHVMKI